MTQGSFPPGQAQLASLSRPARAAVVGASGGIGGALADQLRQAGFETVHELSRSGARHRAAQGVEVGRVDIEDEASIAHAAQGLAAGAPLRLVIVATGVLHADGLEPEKSMRALDADALVRSFRVNAVGPALVAKHVLPLLPKDGKSVFAALSARVGSIEDNRLGGWHAYRTSKAALNQLIRTLSIELARSRPQALCIGLHPGTVDTGLSQPFQSGVRPQTLFTPAVSARRLIAVIDALTPADTGRLFAWDGQAIAF